ncbi:MAG: DUF4340 domain-containing protein [Fusicatenibacter sp.]|nr:DUF4340 domain-containing protein [Fusicatenibacter sp.]
MKKKGKLIGALILLIALCVILIVLKQKGSTDGDESSSASEEETETVVAIDSEEITGLAFTMDGKEVSFTKTEDTWSYDQDETFPLKESKISSIANQVCSITAKRVIEGEDKGELSDYGLDDPTNVLTITEADGTQIVLQIGDENSSSGYFYLMLNEDTDKIYMVSTSFDTMFPENLMACAESESLPSISSDVIIEVQMEGENHFTLSKDTETSTWTVIDENGNAYDTDDDSVSTLTSAASGLSYKGLTAYGCTDFSPYGLDQPKATITVRYTGEEEVKKEDDDTAKESAEDDFSESVVDSSSEETETITVEKELVLLVGTANEDGDYYVTTEGSDEVHLMSASKVEAITTTAAGDYWDLYINMQNVADVEYVEVTYQGETKKIERHVEEVTDEDDESSTTEEVTYLCGEEELDKTDFTSFYSAVISAKAQTKDWSLVHPDTEEELIVTFYKKDGTKFTAAYSKYDSSFYYTEDRYGIPSLVNKNNVKSMIQYYTELFE